MTKPNESAFPTSEQPFSDGPNSGDVFGGLTKREYFAARVMQGISCVFATDYKEAARLAVRGADALIEELARESK